MVVCWGGVGWGGGWVLLVRFGDFCVVVYGGGLYEILFDVVVGGV